MKAYQRKYKLNKTTTSQEKQKQSKVRRLSNLDVCEFVVENNIHTDIELFAESKEQKEAGKKELANFQCLVQANPYRICYGTYGRWNPQQQH